MSRLRMWKSAWVLRAAGVSAMVVASAVSAPAVASAAPPDHVSTFRVFFDRSGEVARVSVHVDYRDVITANGHTIVERDKWMDVFYPDGTARTVGDTVHIQGPAGMVQHDAGQIVFNPDGSVAAIHGPHPQFEGQTFCFALLP
jgi:hypothetical protein